MLHSFFRILVGLVFIFSCYQQVSAQTGCPSVNAGPDTTLPCGTSCVTLHAAAFPSGSTDKYNVSPITYSPLPFNMGTAILVDTDDEFSDTINLPFNFCFFGSAYHHILVGANQVISFNDSNANRYNNYQINTAIPSPGNIPPDIQNSIMAPWQDIDPTLHGNIYYQIIGTAPCRMFVASWDSIPYYGSAGSRDPLYCNTPKYTTSQVILYETTNIIDIFIHLKDTCADWNGGKAVEGILDATGTIADTVPGRDATAWRVQDDAWRFTPNGSQPIYSISWYNGGNMVGSGDSIIVCPHDSLQTTYTAQATLTPCGGGTPVVVTDEVVVSLTGTLVAGIDSSKNVTCYGANNGKAWAHSSGGAIPVTYDWIKVSPFVNYGNTLNIAGLDTGTYIFTATDASLCTRADTVIITGPTALNITPLSQTPTSCATNNGSVTVIASGGTPFAGNPPYNYNWSNNVTGVVDTALAKGPVTVTVTDANACTATALYVINQTSSVFTNAIVANEQCFQSNDGSIDANPTGGTPPYTFVWNNGDSKQVATDLSIGNYICSVSDVNGCSATASGTITQPNDIIMNLTPTGVKCQGDDNGSIFATASGGTMPYHFSATSDGVNFVSDDNGLMDQLSAGNYTVILADNNGCTKTEVVNVPDATPDFFDVTIDSALCYGYSDGAAHIVDSSQQNRPYQYSIDSTGQFQFSSDFDGLAAGNHTITAINKNGCVSKINVVVPQPAAIVVQISPDTFTLALGQSQQVVASSLNAGNPTYSWSPSFGLSCTDCPDPVVGPYVMQDYSVTVSSVNQTATCYGYADFKVALLPHTPVFIPNSFTPNNDGSNDIFQVYGGSIKVVDMKVFNRWGEMVFQGRDQFAGWDGTFKGELQLPGVFSYDAMITYLDNTQEEKRGSVTLIR